MNSVESKTPRPNPFKPGMDMVQQRFEKIIVYPSRLVTLITQLKMFSGLRDTLSRWSTLYITIKDGPILIENKQVSAGDIYLVTSIWIIQPILFPGWETLFSWLLFLFMLTKISKVGVFIRMIIYLFLWTHHTFRYFVAFFLTFENYISSTLAKRILFQITLVSIVILSDHSIHTLRSVFTTFCYLLIGVYLLYIKVRCQSANHKALKLDVQTPISWDLIENHMIAQMTLFHYKPKKLVFSQRFRFLSKNYPFISPWGYFAHSMSSYPEPKPVGLVTETEKTKSHLYNPFFLGSLLATVVGCILFYFKLLVIYGGEYTILQLTLEQAQTNLDSLLPFSAEHPQIALEIEKLEQRIQHYQKKLEVIPKPLISMLEFLQTKRLRQKIFE